MREIANGAIIQTIVCLSLFGGLVVAGLEPVTAGWAALGMWFAAVWAVAGTLAAVSVASTMIALLLGLTAKVIK